ncbi:hypothetical protein GCM10022257_25050 [Hyunsoonleella aestuarii]|uniref:Arm DNA-binding domain-containing protein n=1 Tax=Hyunsoonleella aestuarii TaxID=912802 RepID=A0ABP8EEC4_9FLAO
MNPHIKVDTLKIIAKINNRNNSIIIVFWKEENFKKKNVVKEIKTKQLNAKE